jgi:hypothetical protein
MVFLPLLASTSPIEWIEAEQCQTVCAVRHDPGSSPMASAGKTTPPYWGQTLGDKIVWRPHAIGQWLAVRYAFGQRQFGPHPNRRALTIRIGDHPTEMLASPART